MNLAVRAGQPLPCAVYATIGDGYGVSPLHQGMRACGLTRGAGAEAFCKGVRERAGEGHRGLGSPEREHALAIGAPHTIPYMCLTRIFLRLSMQKWDGKRRSRTARRAHRGYPPAVIAG